jgi:hypothetical protein
MNDLRFAFRQFAKDPGFTAIIVLTLALSIGACTAIYSALDRIVLNPFDDPATKRNVSIRSVKLPQRVEGGISFPDFLDLGKMATSFEMLVLNSRNEVNLLGAHEPLRVGRNLNTPGYFDILGIKLTMGRTFLPEEYFSGKDNVIVLSYGCWQRAFGGAADIIGRTLIVNETPCTVVGVAEESFERRDKERFVGTATALGRNWTDATVSGRGPISTTRASPTTLCPIPGISAFHFRCDGSRSEEARDFNGLVFST